MMIHQFALGPRRMGLTLATVASLATAGLAAGTSYASGGGSPARPVDHRAARSLAGPAAHDPFVDVTDQSSQAVTRALKVASRVSRQPAAKATLADQPKGTVLDISGSTGTVRFLGNLKGYLTGRSTKSPGSIALSYVRQNKTMLGLTGNDIKTFHLARNYRDITGTHHLFYTQRIGGRTVSRNGLTASVSRTGHLLTLGGMPIHRSTTAAKLPPASAETITTPAEALARTRGPVAPGADTSADTATPVVFDTGTGLRRAWETVVTSSETPATTVIDAVTGQVLLRTPLTQYEDATGRAYPFFPGARRGGRQVTVDFTKRGWLGPHARVLSGNNSHAYSDVNDNNRPSKSEEVHPLKGHSWGYRLQPFNLRWAKSFCNNPWPCSWNPDKAFSWKVNRAQNATQVFFFVNNWHDHLMRAPIGFDEAAGNFQVSNHGKGGKGGDPVNTQTDDGANTDHGLPDGGHIDNANMSTPPDGHRPTMQMYLQHAPHTSYPAGDPWSPTNVGDEADTVYHEYTHGLSNRLNVDVRGRSTLGGVQAGAMGEAWSDWYAMDYLVDQHLQRDRASKADVRLFVYDGVGVNFDRTEPIDCKVGQKVRLCNGGDTGHRGGYTYADYGKVVGGPEVHGDGEIWAQTLWSLRHRLGSHKTESLVTRAMELAPYNPSFLDMRNAILIADNSVYRGHDRAAIWSVFAQRGMGYFAGSLGGNDTTPGADFHRPPAHVVTRSITGTVTDSATHTGVPGLTVTLAFQGRGQVNPSAVTDAAGNYRLTGIPEGTYRKLVVNGKGYQARRKVTVGASGGHADFSVDKDWAAASAGATIDSATGAQFNGCSAHQAIDQSQATGESTNIAAGTTVANTNDFHPKNFVVKLPQAVDVTSFKVDPSATCGDGASASTGTYRIETSPDGTSWTTQTAPGAAFTSADDGQLNTVTPTASATNVRYVRFTMLGNQTPDFTHNCPNGGYSGCAFVDLTELEVLGTPSP